MNETLLAIAEQIAGKAFVELLDRVWNDADKALAEWILASFVRQTVIMLTARTDEQKGRCAQNLKHLEAIVTSRLAKAHIEVARDIETALHAAFERLLIA